METAVVLGAVALAVACWVLLFRRRPADIWPRTWAIAGALIAYSLAALAAVGRLDDVFRPAGPLEVGAGVVVGVGWLVATHVGHAVLCRLFPSFVDQVQNLYRLSAGERPARVIGPVLAMAVAEELLFRGVVQGGAGIVVGLAVYTGVQLVERKWALVLAALLGGAIWGALFAWSGGVIAPIVAHAVWTVSLTVVWPLRGCGGDEADVSGRAPAARA